MSSVSIKYIFSYFGCCLIHSRFVFKLYYLFLVLNHMSSDHVFFFHLFSLQNGHDNGEQVNVVTDLTSNTKTNHSFLLLQPYGLKGEFFTYSLNNRTIANNSNVLFLKQRSSNDLCALSRNHVSNIVCLPKAFAMQFRFYLGSPLVSSSFVYRTLN